MPDHGLEAAAVAGRGDDGVGLDPGAVGQTGAGLVERLDARDDLDAPLADRLDDDLVDDRRRHVETVQAAERALLGHRQAVLGEVADRLGADEVDDPVGALRSHAREQEREGGPHRRAHEHVRRGAHREPDPRRAALGEVVGDLHARAARADHQDVAVAVGLGVAVVGRVQQRPAEALAAGPVRDVRGVLVAGRDDHVLGREVGARGTHDPARAVAVDALHLGVQAHVERVVGRVVLEVAGPPRRATGRSPCPARSARRGAWRTSGSCSGAGGHSARATRPRRRRRARAPPRALLCVAFRRRGQARGPGADHHCAPIAHRIDLLSRCLMT